MNDAFGGHARLVWGDLHANLFAGLPDERAYRVLANFELEMDGLIPKGATRAVVVDRLDQTAAAAMSLPAVGGLTRPEGMRRRPKGSVMTSAPRSRKTTTSTW
jgi:hypothetical protein